MDPLDFLEPEELRRFFHVHKTEMSCMEGPRTFLTQLRDHDLIPEEKFQKVSRMKSKENTKTAIYGILDSLEMERSGLIKRFWTCVFKDTILKHYPALLLLRNRLMDGSYQSDIEQLEKVEKEETEKRKKRGLSEDDEEEEEEEEHVNSVKKKKKRRGRSVCEDEEQQPGTSSQQTPGQKKKKICFSSPMKKGEKTDLWTWPIYKYVLPVTCGGKEGTLNRDKLEKGEKCILHNSTRQWFTPTEFERFAGKESSRNWKLSIRCMNTPLEKLIKKGHLKSASYRRGHKKEPKTKRCLFLSDPPSTESEDGEEEDEDEGEEDDLENQEDQLSCSDIDSSADSTDEDEQNGEQTEQPEVDRGQMVFKVTCGDVAATLHKKRFGSGTCGKSIRTETCWLTPVDFVKQTLSQSDANWKKDIKWEGKPLSVLTQKEILIDSPLCLCRLCRPRRKDLDNQRNDDECCICKSEEEARLVMCDDCPRSFHQKCHLPHVDDAILGDNKKWMCTFCVYQFNQRYLSSDEQEMEVALSRRISGEVLCQCQYLLLYLCCADEKQIFTSDPRHLERYSTFVQTPMWLDYIADKLERIGYQTVGDFVSDVELVFTNCALCNRANAEILDIGNRLKKLFDGEIRKVFNICGHDS